MPDIKPKGLLRGERIGMLSDEAKLYWPFIYAASNGYGRFEIDYFLILENAFRNFHNKPTEETLLRLLAEYRDNHLLFVYRAPGGQVWGAFDSASGQRYFSKEDSESPAPPEPAFTNWLEQYREGKARHSREGSALGNALCKEDGFQRENEGVSDEKNGDFCVKNRDSHTTQHNSSYTTQQVVLPNTTQGAEFSEIEESPPATLEVVTLDTYGWAELIELAAKAGMSFDPSEDSDLCRNVWRHRDWSSRRACVRGITERIQCGQYSPEEPQFVPTLSNYVLKNLWRETIRPRNRGQPKGKLQAGIEAGFERIRREMLDAG